MRLSKQILNSNSSDKASEYFFWVKAKNALEIALDKHR